MKHCRACSRSDPIITRNMESCFESANQVDSGDFPNLKIPKIDAQMWLKNLAYFHIYG